MWGAGDPDDRMPMIWQGATYEPQAVDPRGRERPPDEVKFDEELFNFYKQAIALRRQHDALNRGEFTVVATDDPQHCLVISRRSPKQALVIAFNRGNQEAHLDLRLGSSRLVPVYVTRGELDAVKTQVGAVGIEVTLPALTGAVFSSN